MTFAREIESITRGLEIAITSDIAGCENQPTLLIWSKDAPVNPRDIATIAASFRTGRLVVVRRDKTLLPPGLESARIETDRASAREAAFKLLRAALKPEPPSAVPHEVRTPAVTHTGAAVPLPPLVPPSIPVGCRTPSLLRRLLDIVLGRPERL